jgi:hypothetical protein
VSNFDAGRWLEAIALLRIGPDTEIMHERYGSRGQVHAAGCLCPECSELRRAVGGSRRMDREIARMMAVKETTAEETAAMVHRIVPASPAEPVLTPEQEIRAALAAYDTWMLTPPRYPSWMEPGALAAEPGRCRECRWGYAAVTGSLCTHCLLRVAVTRENLERESLAACRAREHGTGRAVITIAMAVAGCILVSMAAAGYPALAIPGLILLAAGVAGALSQ